MYYVMKFLTFLNDHAAVTLGAAFGALLLFGAINWLRNPYRKQNRKLRVCIGNMRSYPAKTSLYMASLPQDYRRQWRAFVNCGTDKPSLVFEFVPKKKRVAAVWLAVASALVVTCYVAVAIAVRFNAAYAVVQAAYWLSFTLILLIDRAILRRNTRCAKRLFALLVSQLTLNTPKSNGTLVEDAVKALNKLNKGEINDATVGKASEILRGKGLDEHRTVEQQRRINLALNGLLQAYARNRN